VCYLRRSTGYYAHYTALANVRSPYENLQITNKQNCQQKCNTFGESIIQKIYLVSRTGELSEIVKHSISETCNIQC
jgi:hypothetical protein